MKSYAVIKALFPRNIFRIARAQRFMVENVFLALEQDGIIGYGEASPNSYFSESAAEVYESLVSLSDYFKWTRVSSPQDIESVWRELHPRLSPSRAAICAVDLALWDLVSKQQNMPATNLAFGRNPEPVATSCTLGLSRNGELDGKLKEVSGFPSLKIKLDRGADLQQLREIAVRSGARLRVDANGSWESHQVGPLSRELADLGIEFLEQPLPPEQDHRMPEILRAAYLPIMADESCVVPADVERMPGRFSGFNIKLVKCGGITPALKMASLGRTLGLKVMVGCMLESDLLIAAGAMVAQNVEFADLDGSWLLRSSPFQGWRFEAGILYPRPRPGLGAKIALSTKRRGGKEVGKGVLRKDTKGPE